ncbi:MAG: VIT domain-containing protein [Armatimonadia bacterium]
MRLYPTLAVAVLTLLVLSLSAQAQLLVPRTEVGKPDQPPLQVKYQHVRVEIDNQVAVTSIEQVFVNSTKQNLEATYFFPLSEQASIFDFAYYVKGERIAGEIREKQEARRTYDMIVSRMKDPAILEQVGRNLFRAQIFPVSPDEPMKVELRYAEILPYDKGRVRYTYPLAMKGKTSELGDLTISVDLKDQKNITRLYSETYDVDIVKKGTHSANASFETTKLTPTKDFNLVYEVESEEFAVNFVAYRPDNAKPGYFMLMMCPQEKTREGDIVKKDVIFVFDRSGSMKGEKMDQAKAAMKYCVENLSPQDRFNIVTFSSDTTSFKDQLAAASKDGKRDALAYIDGLEARGGTAINDSLVSALKMFEGSTAQKTIVFCTDGLPTVGETEVGKIIQSIKDANKRDAHLFCFGVGDDVDDYLLLKLATDNRGAEQHVKTDENIEAKVSEFYDKVSTPLLTDLKLNFGEVSTEMVHPRDLPDVFKGSQLVVAGRYREPGVADLKLTGDLNGVEKVYRYKANFPQKASDTAFVGRVWARKRVDYLVDLMRLQGENSEVKDEIIALSKEWTIQTPYTSFLAVPKEVKEEMRVATTPAPTATPESLSALSATGMPGAGGPGMAGGMASAAGTGGMPGMPGAPTLGREAARTPYAGGGRVSLGTPVETGGYGTDGSMMGVPGPAGPAGPAGPVGAKGDLGTAVTAMPAPAMPSAAPADEARALITRLNSEFATEMSLAEGGAPAAAGKPAETLPFDHWAYDAARKLTADGMIVGYPDGAFRGDRAMTRYEFGQALARLQAMNAAPTISRYDAAISLAGAAETLGIKLNRDAACPFGDVPADHPARKAIAGLCAAGLLPTTGNFDGTKPLLRRDFAQWAAQLLAATGLDLRGRSALQVMEDEKILVGTAAGALQPDEPMKPADFNLALSRILRR